MGEDQSEAVRRERRAWLRVVPSSHHLRGYRDQALPPLHPYCYSEGMAWLEKQLLCYCVGSVL